MHYSLPVFVASLATEGGILLGFLLSSGSRVRILPGTPLQLRNSSGSAMVPRAKSRRIGRRTVQYSIAECQQFIRPRGPLYLRRLHLTNVTAHQEAKGRSCVAGGPRHQVLLKVIVFAFLAASPVAGNSVENKTDRYLALQVCLGHQLRSRKRAIS